MPYQVSMMGWVGSGEDFCGFGWVQKFWVKLDFEKVTRDQLWLWCITIILTITWREQDYQQHLSFLPWPICDLFAEFYENWWSGYSATMHTNKLTVKKTQPHWISGRSRSDIWQRGSLAWSAPLILRWGTKQVGTKTKKCTPTFFKCGVQASKYQ